MELALIWACSLGVLAYVVATAHFFSESIYSAFSKAEDPATDLENQYFNGHKTTKRSIFSFFRRSLESQREYREPEFPRHELAQLLEPAVGPFMPAPPSDLEKLAPGIAVPGAIADPGMMADPVPIEELEAVAELGTTVEDEGGAPGENGNT
ncbi:hypothetical protein C7212DRAFT_340681 [Tuber magnatum]|uniref:Uncharacterized protein n=1 Tax=Tuber magnatum TaxID=42249 RepID=A0A317T0L8_9PEZI|nr:hypothetical protein C7212DRAFT_340681 [Tuber magnatum]